jgi:hypothetical protein
LLRERTSDCSFEDDVSGMICAELNGRKERAWTRDPFTRTPLEDR